MGSEAQPDAPEWLVVRRLQNLVPPVQDSGRGPQSFDPQTDAVLLQERAYLSALCMTIAANM